MNDVSSQALLSLVETYFYWSSLTKAQRILGFFFGGIFQLPCDCDVLVQTSLLWWSVSSEDNNFYLKFLFFSEGSHLWNIWEHFSVVGIRESTYCLKLSLDIIWFLVWTKNIAQSLRSYFYFNLRTPSLPWSRRNYQNGSAEIWVWNQSGCLVWKPRHGKLSITINYSACLICLEQFH